MRRSSVISIRRCVNWLWDTDVLALRLQGSKYPRRCLETSAQILTADAAPYSAEGNALMIAMSLDQEQDGKTFPIETGTSCGPGNVLGPTMRGLAVFTF